MIDHVRVGVVGTSNWSDRMFLTSLNSHAQAQLVAICGQNRERAEMRANKYGIAQVFTDYRAMIDEADLHALVIATPDDLHHPISMHALDAGLHMLCEKPLALNTQQAREMFEKAEARGVQHMLLFTYRWMPYFRYVRTLLDQNYIGRCYHCDFKFIGNYGRSAQYAWRFDSRRANGALADVGSHMIDLARWFVGDIAQVSAHATVFVEREHIDEPANDSASMALEFENGAHGSIQVSAIAHIADRGVLISAQLYGESGSLEVDVSFDGAQAGATIRGSHHDEKQFHALQVPDVYWGDIDRSDFAWAQIPGVFIKHSAGPRLFIDAILQGQPVSPNFYDGLKAQEVIDAALESHRRGMWVKISG